MSNLSFARIMYSAGQGQHSPAFGPVSNFPSTFQSPPDAASQTSGLEAHGATVESILHKVLIALSEKK
jgi:hypothetical protein